MNIHYYESHVTIDPVEGEKLKKFEEICERNSFRVATLLMQRTLDRSNLDSFCTCKSKHLEFLKTCLNGLLEELRVNEFNVRRYKIEAIILDSKIKDGKSITY